MIWPKSPVLQGARTSAGWASGGGAAGSLKSGAAGGLTGGTKGGLRGVSATGFAQGTKAWRAGWNSHSDTNNNRPIACGHTSQATRYQRSSYQSLPCADCQDAIFALAVLALIALPFPGRAQRRDGCIGVGASRLHGVHERLQP